jgi:hypothetical protein
MTPFPISGSVAPGFERVRDAFDENFKKGARPARRFT